MLRVRMKLLAIEASLVPVNTNYRYTKDELVYLWDNADAVACVFHGVFVPTIDMATGRSIKPEEDDQALWIDEHHILDENEIVMGFFLLVAAGNDSTKATN